MPTPSTTALGSVTMGRVMSDSLYAPSKEVVLQLAVRAIRRVHFDTQLFSLGLTGKTAREKVRRINVAEGAEAALETTVQDAFAQEFNASKLAHGWVVGGDGRGRCDAAQGRLRGIHGG